MQSAHRSGLRQSLLVVILLAGMAITVGEGQAASGNGPYYATPSWDQKLPAATRFVVLTDWNNEAVLDRETGLVWERTPTATPAGWQRARFECNGRTTGNRKGWRLPSLFELASLVDPSVGFPAGPSISPGHPFTNVQVEDWYWSATTVSENHELAWQVSFADGRVSTNTRFNVAGAYVWCVRGGINADEY